MDIEKLKIFRKNLRSLERKIEAQIKNESSCCGVTLPQCHILLELDIEVESNIKKLSKILGLDKSTLSRTIDGLIRENMIKKTPDLSDRRFLNLKLTKKGKEKVHFINNMCNNYYFEMFDMIPDKKHDSVMDSISFLVNSMEEMKERGNKCSGKKEENNERE